MVTDEMGLAVVEAVRRLGYEAHWEYPGFVGVTFGGGHYMGACGTDDPAHDWYCCLNVVTPTGVEDYGEAVGTDVPAACLDADEIAQGIVDALELWLRTRASKVGSSN